jgi:hypothetical protein
VEIGTLLAHPTATKYECNLTGHACATFGFRDAPHAFIAYMSVQFSVCHVKRNHARSARRCWPCKSYDFTLPLRVQPPASCRQGVNVNGQPERPPGQPQDASHSCTNPTINHNPTACMPPARNGNVTQINQHPRLLAALARPCWLIREKQPTGRANWAPPQQNVRPGVVHVLVPVRPGHPPPPPHVPHALLSIDSLPKHL